MDYAYARQVILDIVRPVTEPLGLALIPADKPWPDQALRPSHQGLKCSMCQWTNFARRKGVVVGLKGEDIACVPCQVAFGLKVLSDPKALSRFLMSMGYMEDEVMIETMTNSIPFLPSGAFQGVIAFPLSETPLDPNVIWIYGTPAQMSHLVIGLVHELGQPIPSSTSLGLTCCSGFTTQAQIFIPGAGERSMGGTGESELFLALPAAMLEDLLNGLESTRKKGITAPIVGPAPNNMPPLQPMEEMAAFVVDPH